MRDPRTPQDRVATAPRLKLSVWVFALFGPLFGYVTAVTLAALASSDTALKRLMSPLAAVLFAPIGLPMAWIFGVMPAILIGILYWVLRARVNVSALTSIVLATLAAGAVCVGAVVITDGDFAGLLHIASWSMMVVPGIVATPLCAALVERRSTRALKNRPKI